MPQRFGIKSAGSAAKAGVSAAVTAVTRGGMAVRSVFTRIGGMGLGSRLRFLPPGARFDYEREAGDLWSNSVIAICLKWAGDNYPKPLLRVSEVLKDGKTQALASHRVAQLMRRPNKHYTGRVLAKAILLSLVCDGNAYLVKIRNGFGEVVELWWVPHWLMQPCWPEDGSQYVSHYELQRDYDLLRIAPENVIHFRDGLDPRNDRLGLSPMKAQLREVCTINYESGYTASICRNQGVPGLVVVPKEKGLGLTKAMAKIVTSQIRDTTTGDDVGETLALTQPVEIVKVGMSPEEMRLDKLPARAEARICAATGLDPMVVGLPSANKTYSNYGEATSGAWRQCLVPLQDLVAETLQWNLLNEFDDPNRFVIDFDYTHVEALQEDLKNKHDRVRADWQAGLITHAQACELLGYEVDQVDGERYYPNTGADPEPVAPGAAAGGEDESEDDDVVDGVAGDKSKSGWAGWRY